MKKGIKVQKGKGSDVFECQKLVGREDKLCRLEQIFRRYGIEALEELFLGERFAIMEVTFRHTDGYVFEVVVGDAYLPFELPTGCFEGMAGEGMLCQLVQFVKDKSAATVAVFCITTVIDGPNACVGIGHAIAFDGIDKTVPLAKSKVQPAAHGWSAQQVAEEIEMKLAGVCRGEGLGSNHDVSLMCFPMASDVRNVTCDVGNRIV